MDKRRSESSIGKKRMVAYQSFDHQRRKHKMNMRKMFLVSSIPPTPTPRPSPLGTKWNQALKPMTPRQAYIPPRLLNTPRKPWEGPGSLIGRLERKRTWLPWKALSTLKKCMLALFYDLSESSVWLANDVTSKNFFITYFSQCSFFKGLSSLSAALMSAGSSPHSPTPAGTDSQATRSHQHPPDGGLSLNHPCMRQWPQLRDPE